MKTWFHNNLSVIRSFDILESFRLATKWTTVYKWTFKLYLDVQLNMYKWGNIVIKRFNVTVMFIKHILTTIIITDWLNITYSTLITFDKNLSSTLHI